MKRFWLACLMLLGAAKAEDVAVAVAANFTEPAQQIAAAFGKQTGDTVKLSFGSSGQFATEIENGAPFDVFLSADTDHAKALEQRGLTVAGSRFTYATGHLVLWSAKPGFVDANSAVLTQGNFTHISIADPKLAPYGLAAQQYLQEKGLWITLSSKLVVGKSIAQAYEFVKSGNAELGFVALSQVIGKNEGSEWRVPDAAHAPITQQAVLLSHGASDQAAKNFLTFLQSDAGKKIILKFGYN